MAMAYQCDRCGAFFSRGIRCGKYEVAMRMVEKHEDLCPKCGEELEKWMENKAEFVPKEGKEDDVQQDV